MDTQTESTNVPVTVADRPAKRQTRKPRPLVSFRGRPMREVVVAIPQRRTAVDRMKFGEFEGQDKLDEFAASIAQNVAGMINKRGEKLSEVTPYAREYVLARAVDMLQKVLG